MRTKSAESIARRFWDRYRDGIGEGSAYRPWLDVRDVPSRGVCTQFFGHKVRRMHVALSGLERSAILVAQWLDDVADIREQFPLWPLEETVAIAERLGVAHPAHAGRPILMTTDLVITCVVEAPLQPLTIKPGADLKDRRVLEKFEIERLYWGTRGCKLGIVTEAELPEPFVANLRWLDEFHDYAHETLSTLTIERIEAHLFDRLHEDPQRPLNELCLREDDRMGHPSGTSLGVVRHALSRKRWKIPLTSRIDPRQPLPSPERTASRKGSVRA